MRFEDQYFSTHKFTDDQVKQYLANAEKDLRIAIAIEMPEVRFAYSYSALIKTGIAVLASFGAKVKSVPGHHVKVIEKLSSFLGDEAILSTGNTMRLKRNLDFYSGGAETTSKESMEYLEFIKKAIAQSKKKLSQKSH